MLCHNVGASHRDATLWKDFIPNFKKSYFSSHSFSNIFQLINLFALMAICIFLFNTSGLLSATGHNSGALAVNNVVSISAGLSPLQTWGISLLSWNTHSFSHKHHSLVSDALSLWLLSCVFLLYRGTISLPNSFAWGNFGVLAVGIWAVAKKDSIDAILMVSPAFHSHHVTFTYTCHLTV